MTERILMAGHGGQGIIFMGKLLAQSAMVEGREVTFFASYGAEVRGGVSNCSVVISSQRIASPIVGEPDVLVAMNESSFRQFEPSASPEGLIFLNRSIVTLEAERDDVQVVAVHANEIAHDLGVPAVANMVMLGALIGRTGMVGLSTVVDALKSTLPESRHYLLEVNYGALKAGIERTELCSERVS